MTSKIETAKGGTFGANLLTTELPCQLERHHSPISVLNVFHHIRPLSWGGINRATNRIVVCATTHATLHILLDAHRAYAKLLLALGDPAIAEGFDEIRLPSQWFTGAPRYFLGIRRFSPAVRRTALQGWQAWCRANPGEIPPSTL